MRRAVKVKGGTGAGIKDPLLERHPDWVCANGHPNRGFCTRCVVTGCNVKRP